MTELDRFRHEAVTVHQLPEGTEKFLVGQTPTEIEANAVKLADLLASRKPEQTEPEPEVGFFEQAFAAKTARKREVVALFTGRPQTQSQPRDEHGRFAARSGSFDGGARQPAPIRRSPEEEHGEVITQLARLSRLGGSARW
jgi:hypothetical protein